jgi:hypothetical protein
MAASALDEHAAPVGRAESLSDNGDSCYAARMSRHRRPVLEALPRRRLPGALARTIPKQPKHVPRLAVHLNNQLGLPRVDTVKEEEEVCLPATLTVP